MDGARVMLPTGAHIVGYLHSHPERDGSDQRTLSDQDEDYINDLSASLPSSITVDVRMLVYIVTNDEDNTNSYHTYVYDKSRRDDESASCDL